MFRGQLLAGETLLELSTRLGSLRDDGDELRIYRGVLQPEAVAHDTRLQISNAVYGNLD